MTTPLVVDASVAACWLLPDETHPAATAAFERLPDGPVLVPDIWWHELRNIFLVAERRGRIAERQTARALALLAQFPVGLDRDADDRALLTLARRHSLSAYDAAYLELALRIGATLATLDAALARAAGQEGVALLA